MRNRQMDGHSLIDMRLMHLKTQNHIRISEWNIVTRLISPSAYIALYADGAHSQYRPFEKGKNSI